MPAVLSHLLAVACFVCILVLLQPGLTDPSTHQQNLSATDGQQSSDEPALPALERRKSTEIAATAHNRLSVLVTADSHGTPREGWTWGNELPASDILIHNGDVSDLGHIAEYERVVKSFMSHPAKFKIFIGGNHDLTLDKEYMMENAVGNADEPVDPSLAGSAGKVQSEVDAAYAVFNTPEAKAAGIKLLGEGMHNLYVEKADGHKILFKAFVSPYTPFFANYGFAYHPSTQRRFDTPGGPAYIPSAPNERPHFVITHGPPFGIHDRAAGKSVGDRQLLAAVTRVRPLMHLYGHIHESAGASWKNWASGRATPLPLTQTHIDLGDVRQQAVGFDGSANTLFVNAAEKDVRFRNVNPYRLITMDWGIAMPLQGHEAMYLSKGSGGEAHVEDTHHEGPRDDEPHGEGEPPHDGQGHDQPQKHSHWRKFREHVHQHWQKVKDKWHHFWHGVHEIVMGNGAGQ